MEKSRRIGTYKMVELARRHDVEIVIIPESEK